MHKLTDHSSGLLLAAVGTTLFSCKGILIKLCYQYGATPDLVIALRMIFALPFYAGMALLHYSSAAAHLNGKRWASIFVLGLMGYFVSSLLDMHGLFYISASLERIILYAYPSMVLILSVLFLKVPFKRVMAVCIAIIYAGLALVFLNPSSTVANSDGNEHLLLGSAMVFTAAFTYAIFLVGTEALIKVIPNQFYTAIAMLSASSAIFVYSSFMLNISDLWQQSLTVYTLIFVTAFFCTVLPSFMISAAIQRIGAAHAGAVGSAGPLITLLLAAVMLGESLAPLQLLGFVIVMAGIYWLGKHRTAA